MEDLSKYSDSELIKMYEESLDLDEAIFNILPELGIRENKITKEFCLEVLNNSLGHDENFVSIAYSTLFRYDFKEAVDYALLHFKEFHLYSIGTLLSLLNDDYEIVTNNEKSSELVNQIKAFLRSMKIEKASTLAEEYELFLKMYK